MSVDIFKKAPFFVFACPLLPEVINVSLIAESEVGQKPRNKNNNGAASQLLVTSPLVLSEVGAEMQLGPPFQKNRVLAVNS